MPSVTLSQKWDYPALPLAPVAVQIPHGVIGLGSAVSASFNLAPPPIPPSTPMIGNWTPDPTTLLTAMTQVGFDASDAHGFLKVIIYNRVADGSSEVVYDGATFIAPYAIGSSATPITNGLRFRILRDGGWAIAPKVTVSAVNVDGVEVATLSPPVVGNWTPVVGTQVSSGAPIGFDVTDARGLQKIMVYAVGLDGSSEETVYDGTAFTASYNAGSTIAAITNGFRFSVIRNGGWVVTPQITVSAVNLDGIEA